MQLRYVLDHVSYFVGLDGYWGQNIWALTGASPSETASEDQINSEIPNLVNHGIPSLEKASEDLALPQSIRQSRKDDYEIVKI